MLSPEDKIDNANHRLPESVHHMVELIDDDFATYALAIVQQTQGRVVVESLGYRDVCEALEDYHLEQLRAARAAKNLKPNRGECQPQATVGSVSLVDGQADHVHERRK